MVKGKVFYYRDEGEKRQRRLEEYRAERGSRPRMASRLELTMREAGAEWKDREGRTEQRESLGEQREIQRVRTVNSRDIWRMSSCGEGSHELGESRGAEGRRARYL